MKRKLFQKVGCLLLTLLITLISYWCFAEEASNNIAVILLADDGFQSLLSGKDIAIQEVMDIFIAAVEETGNNVLLQGPTTDNGISSLRYRTEDGIGIDWSTMPEKGNANTLRYTINGITKDGFNNADRFVVISGHLGISDYTEINKFNISMPTILIQSEPFEDGSSLLNKYGAVAGLTMIGQDGTNQNGTSVYRAVGRWSDEINELRYSSFENGNANDFLHHLLLETVFDGSIPVASGSFSIPYTYVEDLYLFLSGDDLNDIRLVAPDGTRYPVSTNDGIQENVLKGKEFSLSGQKVLFVSLNPVLRTGEWKIEGINDNTVKQNLYYTLKENADLLIQSSDIIEIENDNLVVEKGAQLFTTQSDKANGDLFVLYPLLRLRVTDTVNDAIESEITATDQNPDRIEMSFVTSGEHTLTFRLMNEEKEIKKQVIHITVMDKTPVFNLSEGEEIIVYPDTLGGDEWIQSVEEWFSDPDGDPITIMKVGGDTNRISLEDNSLIMHFDENISEGSEDVVLIAKADSEEIKATVKIIWHSLKAQMNSVGLSPMLETVDKDDTLEKRKAVKVKAQLIYDGPDKEAVLQELSDCEAFLKNQEGETIANASFDSVSKEFISDSFMLPEKSGEYSWNFVIQSKEGHLPDWKLSFNLENLTIANHPPVVNSDLLDEAMFGDYYAFDFNDWGLTIPKGLIIDSDDDPIVYKISVKGKNSKDSESFAYNDVDEMDPIRLPVFGDYIITLWGEDNDGVPSEEIVKEIHLHDLKEALQMIKGSLKIDPERDQYQKREKVKLVLQLNTKEWSENQAEAFNKWLEKSQAEVFMDNELLRDSVVKYDAENQSFSTEITVPEKSNKYKYQIVLKSSADDQPEVLIEAADPVALNVMNRQPEISAESGFNSVMDAWVMKAEEWKDFVIPSNLFQDQDQDDISYTLLVNKKNAKNEKNQIAEEIELPYTFSFEPFGFFELNREYEAIISASDNDTEASSYKITISLHNKQLLILIIGAAVLLLLIILGIIIYVIHRKNLPQFSGEIYFCHNGNTVSNEIDLAPWKKQKSIPLMIFAGSITILLDNEQWEKMRELEVRPNKREGFRLFKVKAKANEFEKLPYDLSNGLTVNSKK